MQFQSDFYRCISVWMLWTLKMDFKVSFCVTQNVTNNDNVKSRMTEVLRFRKCAEDSCLCQKIRNSLEGENNKLQLQITVWTVVSKDLIWETNFAL